MFSRPNFSSDVCTPKKQEKRACFLSRETENESDSIQSKNRRFHPLDIAQKTEEKKLCVERREREREREREMFWKYIKKHYASELDEQMYPGMPDDRVKKKKKKKFGISKESMERRRNYYRNLTSHILNICTTGIQMAAKRSKMRKKRSSAEFYDPFGESTSFNATTKPMNLKSKDLERLFSRGCVFLQRLFFG